MSTHDFAFGDPDHRPDPLFGQLDRFNDAELTERIRDLEPKARELNRALTDLFGPRRDGEPWAYLGQGDDDQWRVYVTPLEIAEVLPLVQHLAEVAEQSESLSAARLSRIYDNQRGLQTLLGEAARFIALPSTHVKIVRKGR